MKVILFTPRDLAQPVPIGIEHPEIRFEIVYGVSKNKRSWYDNSKAYRLGYRPQDDSEVLAADVLRRERAGDPTAEQHQGGMFVVAEEIPNPAPLPKKKPARQHPARRPHPCAPKDNLPDDAALYGF